MPTITRRTLLKGATSTMMAVAIPSLFLSHPALAATDEAQHEPSDQERDDIAEIAGKFMEEFKAPGLSVAVTRHAKLVYQGAFGTPDANNPGEQLRPEHLFRIASVTKPITSVAIFSLVEAGILKLDNHVFGPDGYLGDDYGNTYADNVKQITLRHVLTHTCGGWSNDGNDPMFSNPQMNHQELIEWTLRNRPLEYAPGTHYAYSNFGYCVLGRLIEKLWAKPYIEAIKTSVLSKCHILDMRLATNEQAPREVRYFGQNGQNPYNMNISRMDSHGGWLATPTDLVRFAICVDGFESSPNILRRETIRQMTTPTEANRGYACGWCVNSAPNWWHNGSLPGTSTLMVRTASGLCWAAFTNTRTTGIDGALDRMMWKLAQAVPAWQA